jgi:formylglycine-generating enzyme required for sulfatase activity
MYLYVSYAKDDGIGQALTLVSALEEAGQRCWIAPRDMTGGANYQREVTDAIQHAIGLVVVLTPGANGSADVRHEVKAAQRAGLERAVLCVEGTRARGSVAAGLRQATWIDWEGARLTAPVVHDLFRDAGPGVNAGEMPRVEPIAAMAVIGGVLLCGALGGLGLTVAPRLSALLASAQAQAAPAPASVTEEALAPFAVMDARTTPSQERARVFDGDPASLPDFTLFRECPECPEMVILPAGTYLMGSPETEAGRDDDEGPQRRVTVPRIAVGRFELTGGEWSACEGCAGNDRPVDASADRRPKNQVNLAQTQNYVAWLSEKTGAHYRLLSEAEWEYAARGGSSTAFSWGDAIAPEQAQYWWPSDYAGGPKRADPPSGPARVGSYAANGFGLFDVHGNVWEWVSDCYVPTYPSAPSGAGPIHSADCAGQVIRGGSWSIVPRNLRAANRSAVAASNSNAVLGFRVVREL